MGRGFEMSKYVGIRLADQLHAEIKRRAAALGVSAGVWLRMLAEKETGVVVPMLEGFKAMDPQKAQAIRDAGVKARLAKKKPSNTSA